MQGRLRVSVTHACQLQCAFCHREGIAKHWTATHMSLPFFRELAQAYAFLGGRYLEITGGEPTLHPSISEAVTIASKAGCDVILCTNGLRLDRVLPQLREGQISLVRLSLHFGGPAPEQAHALLGQAWNFDRIERNLSLALSTNVPVQLIFTHTRQNQDQLDGVLRRALAWNVDVQIVDVIASRAGDPSRRIGYVPGEDAESVAGRYAPLERVISDRTGAVLRLYRTSRGAAWEVKDYHFGVLHSAMCAGCSLRPLCGEGVYALRVDALGIAKPCLLNDELEFRILAERSLTTESLAETLHTTIARMLTGPLEWSYSDAVASEAFPSTGQSPG
jgi:cyclic pyranopterin phosphate synthase